MKPDKSQKYNFSPDISYTLDMSQEYILKPKNAPHATKRAKPKSTKVY